MMIASQYPPTQFLRLRSGDEHTRLQMQPAAAELCLSRHVLHRLTLLQTQHHLFQPLLVTST